MKVLMILPALTEAESPFWRPVKYSLFPPLGLATLAAYLSPDDDIQLVDQHVETLTVSSVPDLVVIQVYITNAYRAYKLADYFRNLGSYVILGGLHVTSLPDEAQEHADSIFIGPGEETFPEFLKDFREGKTKRRYFSARRTLDNLPPVRRDLIKRNLYLVPNSLVVSRGCPYRCNFCYKEAFFKGGKSFYTQPVDKALEEIQRLPGKHLYFLDDHLLADQRFANNLFSGMQGLNRVFQGAATVDSILRGNTIEAAAEAGLRSVFIGFESLSSKNLTFSNKRQSIGKDYNEAIRRLHDLGIMINGSFVFGLDHDSQDVFKRTVDWAVTQGITTATFHIATPYPGTAFYEQMKPRLITKNWDLYDTRHVVFQPQNMSRTELKNGYDWAYQNFYSWKNIVRACTAHETPSQLAKHFFYTAGWKKSGPLWNFVIQAKKLNVMLPVLETLLGSKKIQPQSVANDIMPGESLL